jgi:hypothetical protein
MITLIGGLPMQCHICKCVGLTRNEADQAAEIAEGYDTLCVECAKWLVASENKKPQYYNLHSYKDLLTIVSEFLGSAATIEDIESISNGLVHDPRFPEWGSGAESFGRFFSLLPENLYDYTCK